MNDAVNEFRVDIFIRGVAVPLYQPFTAAVPLLQRHEIVLVIFLEKPFIAKLSNWRMSQTAALVHNCSLTS